MHDNCYIITVNSEYHSMRKKISHKFVTITRWMMINHTDKDDASFPEYDEL